MIKIIDGRKYDTETAELILERDNGFEDGHSAFVREGLYQKHTKEYFMCCESGGCYSACTENMGVKGISLVQIKPMGLDEVKQWVAEHFDGFVYIGLFGNVEE